MERMLVHLFTDDVPAVQCELPPDQVRWAMHVARAARYGIMTKAVPMQTVVGWRAVICCDKCVARVMAS